MTLRVAVVVDGNADGGNKALSATATGLDQVAAKGRVATAAANENAAAAAHEAAANQAAAAAARTHAAALQAQAHAARMAAMQRTNLVFQLNDIFVSLASGMNPMMVAVQQGSQISQIYGPGGLGKALSETGKIAASAATKFAPIAIAAGVAALGVAGLTAAIREETGVEVSWGDTALAVIQTIGDGIYSYIKPAIDAVAPWFQIAWDAIKVGSANLFNGIARSVLTTEATFKYIFGVTVPAAFKLGAEAAAKAFLGPIQFIVDQTIGGVNAIIRALNSVGANISELDPFKVNTDFGGDQALQDLAKGYEDYQKRLAEIQSTDYAAQFFDAVSGRAVVNHNNRQDDKKAGRESEYAREIRQIRERTGALHIEANVIGLSTFAAEKMRKVFELESAARKDAIGLTAARAAEIEKEANAYAAAAANLEYLTTIYDTGKSVIGGFFSDMKSGLRETGDLFGSLGAAGANAFDRIADKALELAANGIWDLLFNAFAGALGGGLGGGFSSQLGRGLTGASVFGGSTGFYGIPGFATGGDFTVGGSGGTDSQLVRFMATPGERVSVRTPGQRDGATVQIIDQRSSGRIDQQRGTGPDGEELVRLIVRDELVEGRRRNAF